MASHLASKLWKRLPRSSLQQVRRLTLSESQSRRILKESGVPVIDNRVAGTRARDDRSNSRFPGAAHKPLLRDSPHDDRQWYLAMTFNRENSCPCVIIKNTDGADALAQHPNHVQTVDFGLSRGITSDLVQQVAAFLDVPAKESESLASLLTSLYTVFTSKDATLIELDPLVRTPDGTLGCLNSSLTIDDAASKRQKDVSSLRNPRQEVPEESEAERYGLVYVKMDGNIGNVVNGAGLAMATNDAIALHGGASANFLDAGGQATRETMAKAFGIVLRDARVTTVLVNIYGGIIRGDMIAESIIGAATELGPLRVPVVVRLQGTNAELGLKMASPPPPPFFAPISPRGENLLLEEADLGLHVEAGFGEAARKAVALAGAYSSDRRASA
ncbi:Succinate--CoA ligase [ADP-forming] subunit beta [Colletotrichum trifolii]|uniref:Succinate--CoA ligase [ADP-forming] subunit beta n=1 Tax=Colletotrichum trifolii TaxID=5466 RepID=A0A4R8RN40_COLTR|nr:Succinate--CoA ligase [ADP-forming] subunit beta [Colletotrichum trifolii]